MTYYKGDPRLKEHRRRQYAKFRGKYIANAKKHQRARKDWIASVKSNPCADCKKRYPPCVIDFDHKPDQQKVSAVSQMLYGRYSMQKLMVEIAKCDLVCANCHRIRTWTRMQAKREKSIA